MIITIIIIIIIIMRKCYEIRRKYILRKGERRERERESRRI